MPGPTKKRLSAPQKSKEEIKKLLVEMPDLPNSVRTYITTTYIDAKQTIKKLAPVIQALERIQELETPIRSLQAFKNHVPSITDRRMTKNQKVKDEIEHLRKQIGSPILTHDLIVHIMREYEIKRRKLPLLEQVKGVLETVRNDPVHFRDKRLDIAEFDKIMSTWAYFNMQQPFTTDPEESIIYKVKGYHTTEPYTRLYGYEYGGSARSMNNVVKRIYVVGDLAFQIAREQKRDNHGPLREQLVTWHDQMGDKYFEKQCGIDNTIMKDLFTRTEFREDFGDDIQTFMARLTSSGMVYDINMLKQGDAGADFEPFSKRSLQDSASERYVSNKFIKYKVMTEEAICNWADLVEKDIDEIHPELTASCMAKLILKTYKDSHDTYKRKKCGNFHDELTLPKIYTICYGSTWDGFSEISMTPAEAVAFFKAFRLGLEIYDQNNILLFSYHPDSYNNNIKPSVCKVIYVNNHVEEITEMAAFEQHASQGTLTKQKKLSKLFMVKTRSKVDGKVFQLVDKPTGVLDLLNGADVGQELNVVYNGSLNELLLDHIMPAGLNPDINLKSGASVSAIYFPNLIRGGKPFRISISNPCEVNGFTDQVVGSLDEYIGFVKSEEKLTNMLINRKNISWYDSGVADKLNKYCINIPFGYLGASSEEPEPCHMVDFIKQYASCLASCPWIPVISPFETFERVWSQRLLEEVGGEVNVKEDAIYIVEVMEEHPLYNKRFTVMFGFELGYVVCRLKLKVLFQLNLITRPITSVSKFIQDLFSPENTMDPAMKKSIPNKVIGMCGKRFNKLIDVQLFKNKDDAYLKLEKSGGMVNALSEEVWVSQKVVKQELVNGFRPIRDMVLSKARLEMFKLFGRMQGEGLKIKGFKTDAIFFEPSEDQSAFRHLLTGALGGVRLEEKRLPPSKGVEYKKEMPRPEWTVPDVDPIPRWIGDQRVEDVAWHVYKLEDERDEELLDKVLYSGTAVLSLAGRGKSYSVLNTLKNRFGDDKVLAVTPFNSQSHNIMKKFGVQSITFHKWAGLGLDGSKKQQAFDMTGFKGVVFDEIMLLDHAQLVVLYNWIKDGTKGIEWYCTGDPKQLEAIGDIIDNGRKQRYVSKLFPTTVVLEENKRMKTAEDKRRMDAAEESLWLAVDLKAWVKENFGSKMVCSLEELKGIKRGVAYFNASAKKINNKIHTLVQHPTRGRLIGSTMYYVDERVVCKTTVLLEEEQERLHTNYIFSIKGFGPNYMVLTDLLNSEVEYNVPYGLIPSHFSLPYCNTVHASQGDGIEEPYLIADWQTFPISKNWLYTAISRASAFDDIHFLAEDVSDMQGSKVSRILRDMVRGYKEQDRLKGRGWEEAEYVTDKWIMKEMGKCSGLCRGCGEHMVLEKGGGNKVTVNRLNNDLAHVLGNCELLCKGCNCGMR